MGLGTLTSDASTFAYVTCLGLDPNRPTWLQAVANCHRYSSIALASALADPDLAERRVVLCIHYPLLDRHGAVYDNAKHGLINAPELIEVLRAAPKKPAMIVHGHEHHGFRVPLELDGHEVPIFNCGSSATHTGQSTNGPPP